jgi:hypothetical protein
VTEQSVLETLDELPDQPIRRAEIGYLEQSGQFREAVPVRGAFLTSGVEDVTVHQLLVTTATDRVIALDFDGEEWGVVYDSETAADAADVDGRYDDAHQILYDLAPDEPVGEDFFEMIVDDDPQYYKWQTPDDSSGA